MTSTLSFLSSQNSLFSTIITFYTLILLYFPSLFLPVISSPIPISTIILLLSLLRLGHSQYSNKSNQINQPQQHQEEDEEEDDPICNEAEMETETEPDRPYDESFVEWDVRAPLEIIYEEREEGEEDERNEDVFDEKNAIQRYASLSLYYPESDSDCSSEGGEWDDSPEKMCFRWEDEEEYEYDYDRDGLIEIELDGGGGGDERKKRSNEVVEEDDNLIEIDLFPAS